MSREKWRGANSPSTLGSSSIKMVEVFRFVELLSNLHSGKVDKKPGKTEQKLIINLGSRNTREDHESMTF